MSIATAIPTSLQAASSFPQMAGQLFKLTCSNSCEFLRAQCRSALACWGLGLTQVIIWAYNRVRQLATPADFLSLCVLADVADEAFENCDGDRGETLSKAFLVHRASGEVCRAGINR